MISKNEKRKTKTSAAFAVLLIGLAAGYALSRETPTGAVEGRLYLPELRKGLSGVRLAFVPLHDMAIATRHSRTGEDGRFRLKAIAAGSYRIAADTRAHELKGALVTISEGDTARVELAMTRTQPTLELAQHQWTFTTGETPKIAATGYYNPAAPAGKDTLRLRVYKTRLSTMLMNPETERALSEAGQSWDSPPGLPPILLNPPQAPRPKLVQDRAVPLTATDKEGFFYQRIPLGQLPLGLYLLDIAHDESSPKDKKRKIKRVCAWALVSDTAIVLKQARNQGLAYTVDMRTGNPLSGTVVRAYLSGRKTAEAVTDSRGLAKIEVPARSEESRPLVVAFRGEDEAVVGHGYYDSEGNGAFAAHIYTDRPIYRPGHLIQYKGILRSVIEPANRYGVPSGESVALEVRDPNGETVLKTNHTTSSVGSFWGSVRLEEEAPTGVYSLIATVRGHTYTQDIVIASYRKPEYAVTITPSKKRFIRGEEIQVTVSGQYYFGAPVAGADVRYSVYRSPDWAADYPEDFEYDEDQDESPYRDNSENYYGEVVNELATVLDENGKATLVFPADVPDDPESPQDYVYTISATVTDASQRQVEADGEVRVVSGDFKLFVEPEGYLGEPGVPTSIRITARDHDRNPVPNARADLQPTFHLWKNNRHQELKLPRQTVTTDSLGRAAATVTPPRSGSLQIMAQSMDSAGRKIYGRGYLWVARDAGGDLDTDYADLSLHTDKRRYLAGETARVLVNSSRTGQTILVTVEGERIHKSQLIQASSKSTVVRIPVLPEYGPNVTLAACYVNRKRFASTETPLRVSMPEKALKVTVTPDKATPSPNPLPRGEGVHEAESPLPSREGVGGGGALPRYKPGERITYTITTEDSAGRRVPAEVSLGVVDEAIFALREDNPAALKGAFYPRRYNRVTTTYSFAVQYLGDANKAEPMIVARKHFPDTAHWIPSLTTDSNGTATASFNLPDNLTTWRATAVAHTSRTAVGRATSKVVCAKDFLVRLDTPRFFTQNDKSTITAFVHNDTGAKQTALVRIRVEGLSVEGDEAQTLSVESGAAAEARWTITAHDIGDAKIKVTAWTPLAPGAAQVQYTDGVEIKLPVRAHGRERFQTFTGELDGAESETEVVRLDPAVVPGSARLNIRLTPSVSGAASAAMEYLFGFPYFCTEQTMSRFLPTLLWRRLSDHNMNSGMSDSALRKVVRQGLARLYEMQHESGAWGWWKHDQDDAWMTAYTLYGLGVARSLGYPVKQGVIDRGVEAAGRMAKDVAPHDRAFLIYSMALAGGTKKAEELRGFVDVRGGHPESLAYTILLNKLLGDPSAPTQISTATVARLLDEKVVRESDMLHWEASPDSKWRNLTVTSAVLRAILAMNPQDERVTSILRWLMLKRTGSYWVSTRDTAAVLAGLADYMATQPPGSPGGEVTISINGKPFQTVSLDREGLAGELLVRIPPSAFQAGKNELTLSRTSGTGALFYSAQLRQTVASEDLPAEGLQGLAIQREYLRIVPRRLSGDRFTLRTEKTDNVLPRGAQIRVKLTIDAPRDLDYVLIEDPFPAGCEVTQRGTADEEGNAVWNYWWSHVDVRDEKVAFFARSISKGRHVIEYNLRAQTPGSYHTLPAIMESMYAPEVHAESAESRVEVRP